MPCDWISGDTMSEGNIAEYAALLCPVDAAARPAGGVVTGGGGPTGAARGAGALGATAGPAAGLGGTEGGIRATISAGETI